METHSLNNINDNSVIVIEVDPQYHNDIPLIKKAFGNVFNNDIIITDTNVKSIIVMNKTSEKHGGKYEF